MGALSFSALRCLVNFVLLRALVPHTALALHHSFAHQKEVASAHARLHDPTAQRYRQRLSNYQDMQYSATMTVGGQELEGILDTGSFELLVFSTKCRSCGSTALFYNDSKSASYRRDPEGIHFKHSFGSGDTWSDLAYDDVSFGPLNITSQYLWEVTRADLPILRQESNFQAIVGIGPITTMNRPLKVQEAETAERNLTEQEELASYLAQRKPVLENLHVNIFSVCFRRGKGEHGYFVWNDEDPRGIPSSPFRRIEMVGNVHWGAKLHTVRLEGGADNASLGLACEGGCAAVVDSGTSLFAVPTAVANRAIEKLKALERASCSDISSFPKLEFDLGGSHFVLPPEAYVMRVAGLPFGPFGWIPIPALEACTLGFITIDVNTNFGPMWIVGMPFFREYYTTFHLGENPGDSSKRSLFAAPAGDDCDPGGPAGLVQRPTRPTQPRQVDLSKVATPHWMREIATGGYMEL
mmetsp:Transcript_77163/g.214583  ORF Transcript_77163/g.214583 Transcript_77163/m.214583 type:complete len:467 (-) Transcript_77163:162-1562(-)